MEIEQIDLNDLIRTVSIALAQDTGRSVLAQAIRRTLEDEAADQDLVLDSAVVGTDQMWLLFSGWKYRIGKTLGLLSSNPAEDDFWEQKLPETRVVFSRLSRKVVASIMAITQSYSQQTGVCLAETYLESMQRQESPDQTLTRKRFAVSGLKPVETHS